MTSLDVSALERASSVAVELLGLTTLRASGAGIGVSGFDAFGRVYVSVAVAEFRRASREDSFTVTVEQSDDGESWEAAAGPLVFTGDGVLFAEIDAPLSFLRVSWVFSARLKSCRVTSASVIPGSLDPPSGGALPAGGDTGQVLTKASGADGDADWETGGGSQPMTLMRVDITVNGNLGAPSGLEGSFAALLDPVAPSGSLHGALTSAPTVVGAGQAITDAGAFYLSGIPDSEFPLVIPAWLLVSNMDGTQSLKLTKSFSVDAHSASGSGGDWTTATKTVVAGTDLDWTPDVNPTVVTTAGGVFIVSFGATNVVFSD